MRLIITICFATLLSCQNKPDNNIKLFDSKQFFEHEITLLTEQKKGVKQLLTYQNKKDSFVIHDTVNWKKELQIFADIDLAKPSNKSTFKIDTIITNKMFITSYTSRDVKQQLKQMVVTTDQKQNVKAIDVLMKKSNSLYQSKSILRYAPDSGFSIKGIQDVEIGNDTEYTIQALFIN
jgi:hypothetical protein